MISSEYIIWQKIKENIFTSNATTMKSATPDNLY
jgi:hypothetical protein